MAYGVVHHFAGGTKEQYEASIAAVHPAGGGLPDGQIFHAAGASPGGWTIMAVHESQASWEQFRDGILLPKMQQGIEGGFQAPPEETTVDLYTVMPLDPKGLDLVRGSVDRSTKCRRGNTLTRSTVLSGRP